MNHNHILRVTLHCQLHWRTKLFCFDLQTYIPAPKAGWKKGAPEERNPKLHIPASCRATVLTETRCSHGKTASAAHTATISAVVSLDSAAGWCWHWQELLWTNSRYWSENKERQSLFSFVLFSYFWLLHFSLSSGEYLQGKEEMWGAVLSANSIKFTNNWARTCFMFLSHSSSLNTCSKNGQTLALDRECTVLSVAAFSRMFSGCPQEGPGLHSAGQPQPQPTWEAAGLVLALLGSNSQPCGGDAGPAAISGLGSLNKWKTEFSIVCLYLTGTTEGEPGSSAHGRPLVTTKAKQAAPAMRPPGLTPPVSLFTHPGAMLLKPRCASWIPAHPRPAPLQHPGAAQDGGRGSALPLIWLTTDWTSTGDGPSGVLALPPRPLSYQIGRTRGLKPAPLLNPPREGWIAMIFPPPAEGENITAAPQPWE